MWTPPGFVPNAEDPEHAFNQTSGQNAFWDDQTKQWTDSKTGQPLDFEQ